MPHLDAHGKKITAPDEIATAATDYYAALFRPELDPSTDGALQDFCAQQFDMWEYEVVISAQTVHDALLEAPKRRTCGADSLVAETWQAAVAADPRVCASLAWAMNRRLTKKPHRGEARTDDTTTTTMGSDRRAEADTRRQTTTHAHDGSHAEGQRRRTTEAQEAQETQDTRGTSTAQRPRSRPRRRPRQHEPHCLPGSPLGPCCQENRIDHIHKDPLCRFQSGVFYFLFSLPASLGGPNIRANTACKVEPAHVLSQAMFRLRE